MFHKVGVLTWNCFEILCQLFHTQVAFVASSIRIEYGDLISPCLCCFICVFCKKKSSHQMMDWDVKVTAVSTHIESTKNNLWRCLFEAAQVTICVCFCGILHSCSWQFRSDVSAQNVGPTLDASSCCIINKLHLILYNISEQWRP